MIFSVAGAISFVVSSKNMHGCDAINPHNIDHFKKKKKDINWTPSIKHWFYRVLPFYCFLFSFWAVSSCSEGVWPLKSCKKLCTEMCVTVYYLNVSGLQSDRHSYNKENMFWTACFCLWLQCVDIFSFKSLPNVILNTKSVETTPTGKLREEYVAFMMSQMALMSC